jgi:hypothetical protein
MSDERFGTPGDMLLLRLQRLIARANLVEPSDRNLVLALIDDFETVRRDLLSECDTIEDQIARSAARTTAIGAYLRGALSRGSPTGDGKYSRRCDGKIAPRSRSARKQGFES